MKCRPVADVKAICFMCGGKASYTLTPTAVAERAPLKLWGADGNACASCIRERQIEMVRSDNCSDCETMTHCENHDPL